MQQEKQEEWERTELSEEEQKCADILCGLIEISTMAQFQMYQYFETVPPEIRAAVYQLAMRRASERAEGQTHDAPRIIQ